MSADTKTTVLQSPTLSDAGNELINARDAGELITIIGQCRVLYAGRGGSDLESGDRHVMMKPDGTVIVHSDDLFKPRNYQPPGAEYTARLNTGGDELIVHVERKKGSTVETIDIMFSKIYALTTTGMEDDAELNLVGTEQDMQAYLMENPNILVEKLGEGFRIIESEHSIEVGNIDIFGRDGSGTPVVVELKRRRVGPKAVDQIRRYVDEYKKIDPDVIGVLIAPGVTDSALDMLEGHGFHFIEFQLDWMIEHTTKDMTLDSFSSAKS